MSGSAVSLPFGRHKGCALADVPTSYLEWLARSCRVGAGLRDAVAAELARRGVEATPLRPPRSPLPTCRRCGPCGFTARWQEDCRGGRRIRADCLRCGAYLVWLPRREPWIGQANGNASATPVLDALTRLDDFGARLHSDGRTVWVPWPDCRQIPGELLAIVRQCSHQLAHLLGRTRRRIPQP